MVSHTIKTAKSKIRQVFSQDHGYSLLEIGMATLASILIELSLGFVMGSKLKKGICAYNYF